MKLVASSATSMLRVMSRLASHGSADLAASSMDRDHVDLGKLQLHCARVDGGEVEDGIDDGEEILRRRLDVAQILILLGQHLPGDAKRQAFGKAQDVGERRTQFIGDIGHEAGLEPVRRLQRLGTLAQRILDTRGVGDVDISEKRVSVGKGTEAKSRASPSGRV